MLRGGSPFVARLRTFCQSLIATFKRESRHHVSGRKTQAPKQTSGRERLSRPDLCVAMKCHILINHQPRRFDVTMQRATRLEFAAFGHENIALHRPSHIHRFRPDLTVYARVLPDRKRSGGIDCAPPPRRR